MLSEGKSKMRSEKPQALAVELDGVRANLELTLTEYVKLKAS